MNLNAGGASAKRYGAYCNSPQLGAMEAYVQYKDGMVDDDGNVTVESTREFLRKYMVEYDAFVRRVLTVLPREP